ncbi:MAG: TOBE domain-containing protein, partial [Clostridia bacterium]|nr:TOBE domain-containing protein [Clostridia bacterium]
MNFFKESTLVSKKGKVYVNFVGGNSILLPKSVESRIKNLNEYLDTGKPVTLGVRPEDIHQDQMFIANSPDTVLKARIEVIEKLGAETQIYCELDYEGKESSVIDNSTQMIAKISSRAVVEIKTVVELAFDANHLHMFDGETEATMLDRDAGYEVIEENAEGSAFVPPTPQEMRAQIDAARIVTKEMKAQMRRDAKMAKKAKKEENAEIAVDEAPVEEAPVEEAPAVEEAPVEAPAEETAETKENE